MFRLYETAILKLHVSETQKGIDTAVAIKKKVGLYFAMLNLTVVK
jgi:hypothetical protein